MHNSNNNKLYLYDYKYIQYCKSVTLNTNNIKMLVCFLKLIIVPFSIAKLNIQNKKTNSISQDVEMLNYFPRRVLTRKYNAMQQFLK